MSLFRLAVVGCAIVLAACGSTSMEEPAEDPKLEESSGADVAELFPDVVAVKATQDADSTWTFAVTLSSPYDSPERYADSWRVRNADGTVVYGERFLSHDHASEQPFTRSQSGIEIPDDVLSVVVEGRDQVSGWGGETIEFDIANN